MCEITLFLFYLGGIRCFFQLKTIFKQKIKIVQKFKFYIIETLLILIKNIHLVMFKYEFFLKYRLLVFTEVWFVIRKMVELITFQPEHSSK